MIRKINKNKFGVIEYAIDNEEDLQELPREDVDNTVYAIMNKNGKRLLYLYSKELKDYILINGESAGFNAELENINEQLEIITQKEKYKYIDDNITDLSTFFQNIDDKYIYIKEGNYTIGNVTLSEDVNIEFHEKAIVTLKNGSSYIFKFQNCENVSVKGKFVGDFSTDIDLLSFENINKLNLDLDISDCGRNGVTIKNCENTKGTVKVTNVKLSGVRIEDSSNVDLNVNVDGTDGTGVLVTPITKDCENVKIKGVIKNCARTLSTGIGVYFSSGDNYIVKNSIIECDVINAGFIGIFPGGDNNTVINSTVDGSGLITQPTAHGIRVHDSSNISLINCRVKNSKRAGFNVNKAHNVSFTNCYAYENEQEGFNFSYDSGTTGRYQGDLTNKNATLTNCYSCNNGKALSNSYAGYFIDGFRNINFINCFANDTQASKTQQRGIIARTNEKTENINIINCNFTENISNVGININSSYLGNTSFIDGEGVKNGFSGVIPSKKIGTYSINNNTTNRYLDVSNTDMTNLSNLVATLILDLANKGII